MRFPFLSRTPSLFLTALLLLAVTAIPASAASSEELELLKQQLKVLQERIEALETQEESKAEEIKEMDQRLNKTELHTATDKLALGVELRSRDDSVHYSNIQAAPAAVVGGFFAAPPNGFNGATQAQIQQAMAGMAAAGMVPPPDSYDADNDTLMTNRFRLEMKSKVNDNLSFAGRLAAYKAFGDSTGVKFNQGSLGDVTFDGNTSSLPHGDTIRLERAYFNYKNDWGIVPYNFSLGRRPSTDGPPLEYRNNSLEGGSPLASIINWQFDGASLNFGLEDATGIPGAALKLCYGVGFEGDWGNSYSLSSTQPDVDDVHMFGFISTLFDDDLTSLVLNYAHAWDITDGFTGLTVMPFIVSKQDTNGDGVPEYHFTQNSGGYISRLEPSTNIGDWDAASLMLRTNFSELFADVDFFITGSWSHTDPSRISQNPYYELMGQGLLSSNGVLESHDGYSIYAGAIAAMPYSGRLGFEYNWGSEYWFNFTGAEDSVIASKLAVRGSVYEAYYIQPIGSDNFFATLGTQFYDYDYTGSGNPLGAPVKISELNAFDALNPVIDEVWNIYLSATLRF